MQGRKLITWMGGNNTTPVSKPKLCEVLYRPPNTDGTRKSCANCAMWIANMTQCSVHDSDVPVFADMICSMHIRGQASTMNRQNMDALDPEFSNLRRFAGGASCDTCVNYTPSGATQGTCNAARGDEIEEETALVSAFGFCTRWSEGE